MSDPFDKNSIYNQYTIGSGGVSFGNPMVDMLVTMMIGPQLANRPAKGSTQSIRDAYELKMRSMEFMRVQQTAVANSLFSQRMGLDPNSQTMAFGSMLFGGPDGMAARLMSPLIGGNPVKAQMGLFANLTGQTMNMFNQSGSNLSVAQSADLMNILYKKMYEQSSYTPDQKDKFKDTARRRLQSLGVSNNLDLLLNNEQFGISEYGSLDMPKISSLIDETDNARKKFGGTDPNKLEQIRQENLKAGNALIDSITNPEAKAKLRKAFVDAMSSGATEATRETTRAWSQANQGIRETLSTYFSTVNGRPPPGGINFGVTRGFQIEDITGSFSRFADLRLMGKQSVNKAFEGYIDNGLGMMDALRGVFGTGLSGSEYANKFSNLMGRSFVDTTNKESMDASEKMLRRLTAAGRVHGVAIEEITSQISEAQQTALMTPGLQGIVGANIPHMVMNSLNQAVAMDAIMDPAYLLAHRGIPGLTRQNMAGVLQGQAHPLNQKLYALSHYMKIRGNTAGLDSVNDYINDASGNSDYSSVGLNNFITKTLGPISGESTLELARWMGDADAADRYRLDNPEAPNLALKGDWFRLLQSLSYDKGGKTGAQRMKEFQELIEDGKSAHDAFRMVGLTDPSQMALKNRFLSRGGDMFIQSMFNPEFRTQLDNQNEAIRMSTEVDTDMAKRFAHLNAPMWQTLINQFRNGALREKGPVAGFLEPLKMFEDTHKKDFNNPAMNFLRSRMEGLGLLSGGTLDGKRFADFYSRIGLSGVREGGLADLLDTMKHTGSGSTILEMAIAGRGVGENNSTISVAKMQNAANTLKMITGGDAGRLRLFNEVKPTSYEDLYKFSANDAILSHDKIVENEKNLRINRYGNDNINKQIERLQKLAKDPRATAKARAKADASLQEWSDLTTMLQGMDDGIELDISSLADIRAGGTGSHGAYAPHAEDIRKKLNDLSNIKTPLNGILSKANQYNTALDRAAVNAQEREKADRAITDLSTAIQTLKTFLDDLGKKTSGSIDNLAAEVKSLK